MSSVWTASVDRIDIIPPDVVMAPYCEELTTGNAIITLTANNTGHDGITQETMDDDLFRVVSPLGNPYILFIEGYQNQHEIAITYNRS
jgi:hypothetical protein